MQFHLHSYGRYSPTWGSFHEANKYSTAICTDLTHQISPKNKVQISLCQFTWHSQSCNKIMCTSTVLNYINLSEKCKNKDTISFTPISGVWLSLRRFSWSSRLLSGIMCTLPVSNFTKISPEISKVHVETHLPTLSKGWLLLVLFSQNSHVLVNSI
jgi:hypothetical protein